MKKNKVLIMWSSVIHVDKAIIIDVYCTRVESQYIAHCNYKRNISITISLTQW